MSTTETLVVVLYYLNTGLVIAIIVGPLTFISAFLANLARGLPRYMRAEIIALVTLMFFSALFFLWLGFGRPMPE